MKASIIDDSSFSRKMIRETLKHLHPSIEITEYKDAIEAIDTIADSKTDLITLDIVMPGMSGIEFLEKLKPGSLQAIIVVITADVQEFTRKRCEELGVSHFIKKPITLDKLVEQLKSILPSP